MLYFGPKMSRSLLNQNQIRHHIWHDKGRVQDNYTRQDDSFGIELRNMFIPFDMDGSAVFFELRVPSGNELENLPHKKITSKEKWDPYKEPLHL